MDKKVCIYALVSSYDCYVQYIGKSINPIQRLNTHIANAKYNRKNKYLSLWINDVLRQDQQIHIIVIEVCNEDQWKNKERKWIKYFGLNNLLNIDEGGDAWLEQGLSKRHEHKNKSSEEFLLILYDKINDRYYTANKYAPLARIVGVDRRTMKAWHEDGVKGKYKKQYHLLEGEYVK